MLYSKQELERLVKHGSDEGKVTAHARYLYKIKQGETKKLLPHEREFVANFLPRVYSDQDLNVPVYNVYELDFCGEALLKQLMVTYLDNLDFLMPVWNGVKYLQPDEIAIDRTNFYNLLQLWQNKLNANYSDTYLHEVRLEYHRKLNIVNRLRAEGLYGRFLYERKIIEQQLNAFYLNYVTKSFFRSHKADFVSFSAFGQLFSCNVYSYVHIVSRHYIPKLNGIDPERSFNNTLPNIDPFNLPYSIRDLILDFFSKAPETYALNSEWMIFSDRQDFYILWWKHKRLKENSQTFGYEIRSLYKIEAERDWQKVNRDYVHVVNERIKYYY
jgi:hypothetical protein